MKARDILLSLSFLTFLSANAYDFSATLNGQKLYFDITSRSKNTACVTFNGTPTAIKAPDLKGTVEIPAKIKHNDVVYTVTEIGPKAFADAKKLEGVIIPSGIEKIGDFAFEGCETLKMIVFPGNPVTLGQGTFFRCPDISSVTIGSDWKSIDFTMFRWSNQLTTITVPAKIEKIQGFKKLKNLKSITVDGNNMSFSSVDGILYSKDGKKLYGCPRGYMGNVKVKDGTESVETGALIDCLHITGIDLPATMKKISFRETSRMKALKTIIVRSEEPLITGYIQKQGKFLFELTDQKTEIVVPSASKNKYIDILAIEGGEYSISPDGTPYSVEKQELPLKKNIKGVKNFEKY